MKISWYPVQRCIEDHLARAFHSGAKTFTAKDAPVFQREYCLHCLSCLWEVDLSILSVPGHFRSPPRGFSAMRGGIPCCTL